MTTALDSNIVIALWSEHDSLNRAAKAALETVRARGPMVICAFVYVEIRAFPSRSEGRADEFLAHTGISVDWATPESIWREAAQAAHMFSRRRTSEASLPRRVAADFIIGAHAVIQRHELLTLDRRGFRTAFPRLQFAPESS